MVRAEIATYQQTADAYRSKLEVLKQEEASLMAQLASMQSVLSQYEELMRQNKKLQDAVDQERKELEELRRERRRTYDNMLTAEE